ncbi:unnamed protein product [Triticum turgidum subsp. durum]|uniref:Pectinesterase inhibitor domain-containing protein n=1 Tax=Triticum turgidum subsp. durum TaxID=4567 RepID=A0A9R1ASD6_TRITD|nr:unnamed protein product [Triticum turgidum subsp. durum]
MAGLPRLVVLLLLVFAVPVAQPTPYSDNLQDACNKTLFPKVCIQSLTTNPETRTADARRLAELSVYVAKEVGTTVAAFAHHELSGVKEDTLFKCLDGCSDDIEETVAHLSALTREPTCAKFLEIKSWLSATLGGSNTCEETCKDAPISDVKNAVVTKSLEFEKLLRVTLDLITEASGPMPAAGAAVAPTAWDSGAPGSYGASTSGSYGSSAPESFDSASASGSYGSSAPESSDSASASGSYGSSASASEAPSTDASASSSAPTSEAPSADASGSYGSTASGSEAPSADASAPSNAQTSDSTSADAPASSYGASSGPAADAPSASPSDADAPSSGAADSPSSGASYGSAGAPSPSGSGASAPEADSTA